MAIFMILRDTNLKNVQAVSKDFSSQVQVDRPRKERVLGVNDVLLDGSTDAQDVDVEGFLLRERVFPGEENIYEIDVVINNLVNNEGSYGL